MLRPLFFRAASLVALAAALARPAAAQDETPPAKLLPPTVYAYVAVPDVAALKERVGDSAFGAMLDDPKLQPAIDGIKEKLSEVGGQVQENLGVSTEELLKVPSGEVVFAVFDVPGESVGFVLLVDYGDNAATVDKLVQKAESELEEKGAERTEQEFEGTTIVVYETKGEVAAEDDLDIEGEESPPSGAADTVAWFRKDNRVVVGSNVPALEAVLARWSGEHDETFAGNEVYSYVAEKIKSDDREPALVWYVDPIGGLQTALTRSENVPPMLQMVPAFLPMLGLTNLKAIGGSADAATQEFDSVTKVFIYVEPSGSENPSVFGVFDFPPTELAPPQWVAESATGYFGANWNVAGAVATVEHFVDLRSGPGYFDRLMQQAADSPTGPKLNPQTDFLDQLAGPIHVASYPIAVPRTQTAEGAVAAQQPTVIALDIKDEQKMNDVLAKVAQTPNFPGESRQFQGTTVYEMPLQNPGGEPGKMGVAVAKGALIFSTDVSRLEEVLRGNGGTPLAETESYQKIAEHFPEQVSLIGYQDQRDQLKAIYEAFRSGEAGQQVEGFDFSTLPPFEDIAKYLRTTGSYAVPDENGALLVSFSLKMDE